jgi:hypothetical protein
LKKEYRYADMVRLKSERRGANMLVLEHRRSDDAVFCSWPYYEGLQKEIQIAAFDAVALELVQRD